MKRAGFVLPHESLVERGEHAPGRGRALVCGVHAARRLRQHDGEFRNAGLGRVKEIAAHREKSRDQRDEQRNGGKDWTRHGFSRMAIFRAGKAEIWRQT
ncbi:hypothetical protein Amme_200_006 [Acidomonas methanolica NBRC 104435]|uniref:Uncharacterized protein n=1 Tax=Acidomonas methanolica NBRC 104435 TaxID=1231351 RepID=A0A023D8Y5_ACIMT|nr:hypothetical protein Amme_200_006 [Acidomonas methanolica NBRC 104435]GEK99905.1 hypothetical protein AME01nite_24040 [Acidomonas methanolica NBRC 104435]